ncbi:SDR family NAD(P)-dependent oxidoreductase [Galbibacter sp. EGI 63066]|uniref:SDR family NAD(P)-dependent oxidoreductase n=1 Tax=Galbibacter sp. EGI 63066 TaxID=2993559 RepID=UPI0022493F60|nr:SDR family NAD(P)-dependent oxidoreductase [Galbibacter sp. EGI 63066]MCX2681603.1 SDR family NAD(P)-dependent oxidoreductase [Galbibacter sp. EGI 63066]
MNKTIAIFGAGEGISFEVAKKFIDEGFSVILVSRKLDKLEKLRKQLKSKKVKLYAADLSDENQFAKTLELILQENERIDVILYNAARVKPGNVLEESFDDLVNDFKTNVTALLPIVAKFKDRLFQTNGALLVTGGGVGINPNPEYASLSLGKAALRNLTQTFAKTLSEENIFVATVIINGYVQRKNLIHNPKAIAKLFWGLYTDRSVNEIII